MGHIRFLQAGFLGGMHGAVSFRLMEPIGPGRNLDLPPNAKLLADKAYPEGGVLMTPVRANQLPLLNNRKGRRFEGLYQREESGWNTSSKK